MPDLLPPNATPLERALARASERLDALPVPVRDMWDPARCPVEFLPWLAWAFSVDVWDEDWPEEIKRRVVAESIELHRLKGTPWAVKEALRKIGYLDARLREGLTGLKYDGSEKYDGSRDYSSAREWWAFIVELDLGEIQSITAEAAATARSVVERTAPESRTLRGFRYRTSLAEDVSADDRVQAALSMGFSSDAREPGPSYDGSLDYDGMEVHGPPLRDVLEIDYSTGAGEML